MNIMYYSEWNNYISRSKVSYEIKHVLLKSPKLKGRDWFIKDKKSLKNLSDYEKKLGTMQTINISSEIRTRVKNPDLL